MDSKQVTHAVQRMPGPSSSDPLVRALLLLVSNGGGFSSGERWFHDAVTPMVSSGHLRRESTYVSFGDNIEEALMDLMKVNTKFVEVFREYRKWALQQQEEFELINTDVLEGMKHFRTTDQQLMYAAQIIAELTGEVEALREALNTVMARLNDISINQSVLESVVYGEDTDS